MTSSFCPLDVDVQNKLAGVGKELEDDIRAWVEGITGEKFPDRSFGKSLKNGIILCNLANKIKPGICAKPQKSPAPFVQMENINAYLTAARKFGIQTENLFMTVDLFEEKNIGQVIRNLDTLRRLTGANPGNLPSAPASSAPSSSTLSSSSAPSSIPKPTTTHSWPSSSSATRPRAGSRVPVGLVQQEEKKNDTPLCPLDKDVHEKLASVGSELEGDMRNWIENLTGEKFSDKSFGKSLKNGILLCQLANKIRPGICPKIQKSPAPFVQMENINAYLNAARQLGVPTADLFMTVDLFEEKNIGQVIRNLDALRRVTRT
jgi:hypothetical protein